MDKKGVVKFLIGFLLIQRNIIGTNELPLDSLKVNTSNIKDDELYLWFPKDLPQPKDSLNEMKTLTNYQYLRPRLEHNYSYDELKKLYLESEARHNMNMIDTYQMKMLHYQAHARGPEDLIFMITALVLVCFHLFFLDVFIRMTRLRFQNSSRYQYLSTVHLLLSFLVCVIYFLLILLHYKDSNYY